MLVTLSLIQMANGEVLNIGAGARLSLSQAPGTDLAFDPETGLVFACVGTDVHVVPSANVRQMRVAESDVPALREWLRSRATRPKTGKAA